MSGFGAGKFGQFPFGTHDWSRTVLYRSMPALYQGKDAEEDFQLQKLVEGQRPSFETLRSKIRFLGDLRDPLKARSQYDETTLVTLGSRLVTKGEVLQRGFTGSLSGFGEFISSTARFTPDHVGKELELKRSTDASHNVIVTIAQVDASAPTVAVIAPALSLDAGPLAWELREPSIEPTDRTVIEVEFGDVSKVQPGWSLFDGFSEYEVLERIQLPGATEREGGSGTISKGRFIVAMNEFTLDDVGKRLSILDSVIASNNDRFEITNILTLMDGDPTYSASDTRYRMVELRRIGPSDDLDAGTALVDDSPTISWAVLPHPRLALSGQRQAPRGVLEQTGFDAWVRSADAFTALVELPSGRFVSDLSGESASFSGFNSQTGYVTIVGLSGFDSNCIGQRLVVSGAATSSSNSTSGGFLIVAFHNANSVTYLNYNGSASDAQDGHLVWQYLSPDRGKQLTVRGPGTNNTTVIIQSVGIDYVVVAQPEVPPLPALPVYAPLVALPAPIPPAARAPLEWEIRRKTGIGDLKQVQVRAPSLLQYLAKDYGIDVDIRESENHQRSWVNNNSRWIGIKGLAESYRILGAISGFDISAKQLYRVSQDLLETLSLDLHEVGEYAEGRSAPYPENSTLKDGKFETHSSGHASFFSPSAKFRLADIGLQIRIQGSLIPGNNKLYTIESLDSIDPTHKAVFRAKDTAAPDTNLTLQWNLTRLYTTLPPLRPRYDELNPELMGQLLNTKAQLSAPGTSSSGTLLYTAVTAGTQGNAIGIVHIAGTALQVDVVDAVDGSGKDIQVTFDAAPGGTQVNNVVTAILNTPAAAQLVTAQAVGGTGGLQAITRTTLAGGYDHFSVDKLCWEPDFLSTLPASLVAITSVTSAGENLWQLIVSGPLAVVQSVSNANWRLTDANGFDFFLESVPVAVGPTWKTTVYSSVAPVVGPSPLSYDCLPVLSSDYTPSNRLLLTIASQLPVDVTALQLEQVLNRMLERIKQVTPAHVVPVVLFVSTHEARVDTVVNPLSAFIETGITEILPLYAPVQGYYDALGGDVIPADSCNIYVTIETA